MFGTPVNSMTVSANGNVLQVTPAATTPNGSTLVFAYEVVDSLGQAGVTLVKATVAGGAVVIH